MEARDHTIEWWLYVVIWRRFHTVFLSRRSSWWWALIFPNCSSGSVPLCVDHIKMWAVALRKLPSQTNVVLMPTNIQPAVVENIFQFLGLRLFALNTNASHCLKDNWGIQDTIAIKLIRTGQKWWSIIKLYQRVTRGLSNIIRGLILILTYMSNSCGAHWQY